MVRKPRAWDARRGAAAVEGLEAARRQTPDARRAGTDMLDNVYIGISGGIVSGGEMCREQDEIRAVV